VGEIVDPCASSHVFFRNVFKRTLYSCGVRVRFLVPVLPGQSVSQSLNT
jgi:hypothetical protein